MFLPAAWWVSFQESLQKDFGTKTGDMLWNYCRGIDNRPVEEIQVSERICKFFFFFGCNSCVLGRISSFMSSQLINVAFSSSCTYYLANSQIIFEWNLIHNSFHKHIICFEINLILNFIYLCSKGVITSTGVG